mmetsp:Transcript_18583/g.28290  ORF Transcript_18583/g.28290 Transcript_18583/m.28290 type:complete len:158 (-) Transcript_18583:148-621(-)
MVQTRLVRPKITLFPRLFEVSRLIRCTQWIPKDDRDFMGCTQVSTGLKENKNNNKRLSSSLGNYWPKIYRAWAKEYGGWKAGLDLIAPDSIAFHKIKSELYMKRHHAMIYNSCPPGTVLHDVIVKQKRFQIQSSSEMLLLLHSYVPNAVKNWFSSQK